MKQTMRSVQSSDPFVFVVGRGRSGTTLLRAMLDSHPDMAIPPESHFIVTLAKRRRRYETKNGLDVDEFLGDLWQTQFRGWGLAKDDTRAALLASRTATYPDAVRALFRRYAKSRGKSRYGEKTPVNVRNIALLASLFPEARFVHLVRDGRDVTLSYLSVPVGPSSVPTSAVYWRLAVERGRKDGLRLAPDRYREFHYEALVEDPISTLRNVCGYCLLPFDSAMLSYYQRADDVRRGITNPTAHPHLSLPPTAGLRDWHRDMAMDDVAMFEALAGRTLERFGYERAFKRVPPAIRVRTAGAWVSVQSRRVLGRAAKLTHAVPRGSRTETL